MTIKMHLLKERFCSLDLSRRQWKIVSFTGDWLEGVGGGGGGGGGGGAHPPSPFACSVTEYGGT